MLVTVPEDHGATDILEVIDNSALVRPHDYPEDVYPALWYYFSVTNDSYEWTAIQVTITNLPSCPPELGTQCYEPFWRSSVWSTDGRRWERIPEEHQFFGSDSLEIHRELEPGGALWIAETYPITYSDYLSFMARMLATASSGIERSRIRIGESEQGRPIFAVRLAMPSGADKKVILLVSGQHAVEESGRIFTRAVIEWLSQKSGEDERAKRILENCDVYVAPMANPDGCYEGRMNTTARGLNPLLERAPETARLIQLIDDIQPDLMINAHGWGNLMGDAPHEGWYRWEDDDPLYQHMRAHVYGVASVEEGETRNLQRSLIKETFQLENHAREKYGTLMGILEINWNSCKPSEKAIEVRPTYQQLQSRSLEYFAAAASMLSDLPTL